MKSSFFLSSFLSLASIALFWTKSAGLPSYTCYSQMNEINEQWIYHEEDCPKELIVFANDEDRIQMHLNLVIENLLEKTPENLATEKCEKRIDLLKELSLYANRRIFPQNLYHSDRQTYFVDHRGVHCAVGYMIAVSGHGDLVARIQNEHNYDYIADIKTAGLIEWADEHGFLLHELEWIQPTYAVSNMLAPVGSGTNGGVNDMVYDSYSQRLILSGNFTELNGVPCSNVGYYQDDQLQCLGGGVSGVVHDVLALPDMIVAVGLFDNGLAESSIATFDGVAWAYADVPGLSGFECTSIVAGGYGNKFIVAVNNPLLAGTEIWMLTNSLAWKKLGFVNGVVLDAAQTSGGKTFVGSFNLLTAYNSSGAEAYTVATNNVATYVASTYWNTVQAEVSDTVKSVIDIGGALYLGGTCTSEPGGNNICLTRYYNELAQPLFYEYGYSVYPYSEVNAMVYGGDGYIYLGGNFSVSTGWTFGNNFATYNIITNQMGPLAMLDNTVNAVGIQNGVPIIGGEFMENLSTSSLNHLAKLDEFASDDFGLEELAPVIYPNPFVDCIYLNGVPNNTPYKVVNAAGQVVLTGEVVNEKIEDLSELTAGIYVLNLLGEQGFNAFKITKE